MAPPGLPLLLIPVPSHSVDVQVRTPRPNDNLFNRLIRDPQAPDRPMRERQCAEMLRGVLTACPGFASYVFAWLATYCQIPISLINELDWRIETEQAIGAKRDDLRIEGIGREDGTRTAVLWTIEIKVAAPFHESTLQDGDEPSEPSRETETELVNQLINYDNWLNRQASEHRAGFVLALRDQTAVLPTELKEPWHCLTWTELALAAGESLIDDVLPPAERLLVEHMLGFIRHRLWDTTNMTTSRLELDDVALLRALAAIGPACSRKLKNLVEQFHDVLEATGIDFTHLSPTSSFFDRSDVAQYAMGAKFRNDSSWLSLNAGVVGDAVRVWVSCNPNVVEVQQAVSRLLRDRQSALSELNPGWVIHEKNGTGYIDAEISKPLVSVLASDDWQPPLIQFVRDAIGDLKEVGVLEGLTLIPA